MERYGTEELLACVVARLVAGARHVARPLHVAVGAASPIPAAGVYLERERDPALRLSLLQRRKANPFTEGSRELFDLAGQGRIDVFFLGGAQIDGAANINLVQAGGKRFPGSFGSAFMYPVVPTVILFREEHSPRVLVPRVEFISAAGDPAALVTGKALFSWQKDKRRFRLDSLHPGVELQEIVAQTGFSFDVLSSLGETPEPTEQELALLRGKVAAQIARDYPHFAQRIWGITTPA